MPRDLSTDSGFAVFVREDAKWTRRTRIAIFALLRVFALKNSETRDGEPQQKGSRSEPFAKVREGDFSKRNRSWVRRSEAFLPSFGGYARVQERFSDRSTGRSRPTSCVVLAARGRPRS